MLRVLAVGLLLVNVWFFSWAQGWFEPGWPAPGQSEREPARLKAQLRPEAVTVTRPGRPASRAASPASTPASTPAATAASSERP